MPSFHAKRHSYLLEVARSPPRGLRAEARLPPANSWSISLCYLGTRPLGQLQLSVTLLGELHADPDAEG
jgi:hypothetical protein